MTALNTRRHETALLVFMVIVFAHLAEHVVQAIQIWALDMPRPEARGVLGNWFPWLVTSEALHYGYALVMLIGLIMLRPGFTGSSRTWWNVALVIQIWHHLEHLLLLGQKSFNHNLFGEPVPTSILQLFVMRVELHIFYNTIVLVPMLVAMWLHRWPRASDPAAACTCSQATAPAAVAPANA